MKETNPELSRLLEKYRQGQCTNEEKAQLMAWLDLLEQTEEPLPLPEPEVRKDLRSAFVSRVTAPAKRRAMVVSYKRYIAVAAVISAVVCLGAAFFLTRNNSTSHSALASIAWDTLSTKTGEVRSIRLSDNSIVALNANTRIRVSKSFGLSDRKLELIDGEAWFDVKKNASLPFTVQCQQTETRVLGTRFVISAYRQLPDISVQVTEGKVAVALPDKTAPLITPGQVLQLQKATGESTQGNFDRAAFDPLQQTCFIRNGSFNELALRIKNTFGYTLIAQTPDVSQRHFTGEFRYNENIKDILEKFSEIHGGRFRMEGDKVFME